MLMRQDSFARRGPSIRIMNGLGSLLVASQPVCFDLLDDCLDKATGGKSTHRWSYIKTFDGYLRLIINTKRPLHDIKGTMGAEEVIDERWNVNMQLHPQPTSTIRTGTDTPRLSGVPVDIQDTQFAGDLVALEDLEGNDAGVAEHVTGDATVEDLKRTVVTGVGEEGIASAGVETDGPNGFAVVAEGLVGPLGQLKIVPQ